MKFSLPVVIALVALVIIVFVLTKIFSRSKHKADWRSPPSMGDLDSISLRSINSEQDHVKVQKRQIVEEPKSAPEPIIDESVLGEVHVEKKLAEPTIDVPQQRRAPVVETPPAPQAPILLLHIFANEGQYFDGYDLMQAVTGVGMEYDETSMMFQHHERDGSEGFSLVQAVEPGTFDLNSLGGLQCPGVMLFLKITEVTNPTKMLEDFLCTGQALADTLNGSLCDDRREPLSEAKVLEYREIAQQSAQESFKEVSE